MQFVIIQLLRMPLVIAIDHAWNFLLSKGCKGMLIYNEFDPPETTFRHTKIANCSSQLFKFFWIMVLKAFNNTIAFLIS